MNKIKIDQKSKHIGWWVLIASLVVLTSYLHYSTSTMKWQYHLIYMQLYFVPILIAAFQFGTKGGLGVAIAVSIIYFPHIMLQWGGIIQDNLMRFLQIVLFNVIGFITGYLSQREKEETVRYQQAARELRLSLDKIKEQSQKLSAMEEQLRNTDRLAIIGELTASLAHEVRNPLGSIRGAVEILQNELPPKWRDSEFFNILIQETDRLNSVVENYLSFARRRKHSITKFDIRETIQNSLLMVNSSMRKRNIRLLCELPDHPLLYEGDPVKLQQVLTNLVLNSIQAMPEGGVLEVKCEDAGPSPAEESGETQKRPMLRLHIKDSGVGMETGEVEKIFDPFYSTKPNGTGLGLAIVKRIVEEEKWLIQVHSAKGKGTEFILTIPLIG